MAPSFRSLPLAILLILCTMLLPSWGDISAGSHDLLMLDRFHRWMSAHGRSYPSADEKLRRFEVYRRNVEYIDATNREVGLGYELGENEFTDLTNDEFVARYTGGVLTEDDAVGDDMIITTLAGAVSEGRESTQDEGILKPIPQKFDWREHGAVTPAKSQGRCGSCWAFSTVATVESMVKIKGGNLLDLSEQELVDCELSSKGCKGGWPYKALKWIQAKGGIVAEAEYPYAAKQGKCRDIKSANRVGNFTSVNRVPRNELSLLSAVLHTPVSVCIDASGSILQHYKAGIYQGPCTTRANHAVVAVGYGVSEEGVDYWIVKNSWGQNWGQKGFFFMRRGAHGEKGLCGIALWGVYPDVKN